MPAALGYLAYILSFHFRIHSNKKSQNGKIVKVKYIGIFEHFLFKNKILYLFDVKKLSLTSDNASFEHKIGIRQWNIMTSYQLSICIQGSWGTGEGVNRGRFTFFDFINLFMCKSNNSFTTRLRFPYTQLPSRNIHAPLLSEIISKFDKTRLNDRNQKIILTLKWQFQNSYSTNQQKLECKMWHNLNFCHHSITLCITCLMIVCRLN